MKKRFAITALALALTCLLYTSQPMKIGELEIKNRFVMPAMNSHYADAKHHICLLYTSRCV